MLLCYRLESISESARDKHMHFLLPTSKKFRKVPPHMLKSGHALHSSFAPRFAIAIPLIKLISISSQPSVQADDTRDNPESDIEDIEVIEVGEKRFQRWYRTPTSLPLTEQRKGWRGIPRLARFVTLICMITNKEQARSS